MNLMLPLAVQRESGETPRSSMVKILEGALDCIMSHGSRRLSMSDICNASGVSRGTLYRYFADKEGVLAAVSEFVSASFESGVRAAAEEQDDPIERFRAVMRFFAQFTIERTPDRIFEIEPGFHLDFFRSHFRRHKAAVMAALAATFDHVDARLGTTVDRAGMVEMLIRMQLSTMIVPADIGWVQLWDAAPDTLERYLLTGLSWSPGPAFAASQFMNQES